MSVQLVCQWFLVFWLLVSFLIRVGSECHKEQEGLMRTVGVFIHLAVFIFGTLLLYGAGAFSLLVGVQ